MVNKNNRPANMSQLDYLWTYFGDYSITNNPSSTPSDTVVLTEQAVVGLINAAVNKDKAISRLEYKNHSDDPTLVQIVGYASDGTVLSTVDMPAEVHVTSFTDTVVTSADIKLGCPYPIGTNVIKLVQSNGIALYVNLDRYRVIIKGSETDSIKTEYNGGIVSANLKIDTSNLTPISLSVSPTGLSADLNIDESGSTGVQLSKEEGKLSAKIPFLGTPTIVGFEQLSIANYLAIENPIQGRIYFITDMPYIYLNGVKYGFYIPSGELPIISIKYNSEKMTLQYKTSDGSDYKSLIMGPATREQNGMLAAEDFTRFDDAYYALSWQNVGE